MTSNQTYLTAVEAARLLGVTTRTIRRWKDDGTLVPVEPLASRRHGYSFDPAAVHALAKQRACDLTARAESIQAALAGSTAEAVAS